MGARQVQYPAAFAALAAGRRLQARKVGYHAWTDLDGDTRPEFFKALVLGQLSSDWEFRAKPMKPAAAA